MPQTASGVEHSRRYDLQSFLEDGSPR